MRYKKHGVLLESAQPWQIERDGQDLEGRWDAIFRSALASIAYKDWNLFGKCLKLCQWRVRWPMELDMGTPSRRRKMTRDPYIMTLCAASFFWKTGSYTFKTVANLYLKIPFRLYSPVVWAWRRYLITGKGKKWWEFLEMINLKFKHRVYSLHLCAWRAYVGESVPIKANIRDKVPGYNYLIRALCHEGTLMQKDGPLIEYGLKSYQPRIKNYWTSEPEDAKKLPLYEHDEYQLDKDILQYVLDLSQK